MDDLPFLLDLDLPTLSDTLQAWGEPEYRARQIWQGLYQQLWDTPDQFSMLSRALRQKIGESFSFAHLQPKRLLESEDGETRKTLFELPDGQSIETVLMRYKRRNTLCISTQVGCAMGCTFCATGQMGFRRHLSSGEIVEQVLVFARQLAAQKEQITNVVLMGMGEPFHNYQATMAAIDRLNHHEGFNFGARRFTLSTVGLTPMIWRFAADVKHPTERQQVNLAISLHAADDELRASMLPVNRKYPLDELSKACHDYVEKTHRRITFEWALIQEVNDTPEQARKLAEWSRGLLCHVNVIPLNPTQGFAGEASTLERARHFQAELERLGMSCTIRLRRGIDIQAGCGQLASQDR